MNKKFMITLVITILVIFGYYTAIKLHQRELESLDRTVLFLNYDDSNYFGTYDATTYNFNLIELDENLTIDGKSVIGDFDNSTDLLVYLKNSLQFTVDDVFEFDDNNKLIANNVDEKDKKYYSDVLDYHQTVVDMLAGDASLYHPKYNNILVRIATDKGVIDDGVMTKKVVRAMIDADITQEEIDSAFVTVTSPALECEKDQCIIIEPYYNEIRKSFNQKTDHDLPEYSKIKKEEE